MTIWTGVGSRSVAEDKELYEKLVKIGCDLTQLGWTLRSGGADGADEAFETGWNHNWYQSEPNIRPDVKCEIYLPWKGFNSHTSPLYTSDPDPLACEIAAQIHPRWKYLSPPVKKLHARNIHQVLGQDCKTPSDIVVCWTPDGKSVGGTRTAIICADMYKIPVVNLGEVRYSEDNDIIKTITEIVNATA